jgi:glycosyltransferase involved in cell wall biosynthesis
MRPNISVVISVYNQADYLTLALNSLLRQTYKEIEVLVADDASKDGSLQAIKKIKDERLKVFCFTKKRGLAKNLNFLIKQAKSNLIARMDGDDVSMSTRLAEQINYLHHYPQTVLLGSWAKVINGQGKEVGEIINPVNYQKIKASILAKNVFVHPSIVFRKETFLNVGGYDESLPYCQDYDLFLRLVSKYPCANLPKFLLQWRWLPNYEKQQQQHLLALKIRLRALRRYGYPLIGVRHLVRPFLSYLVPSAFRKLYWQKIYGD